MIETTDPYEKAKLVDEAYNAYHNGGFYELKQRELASRCLMAKMSRDDASKTDRELWIAFGRQQAFQEAMSLDHETYQIEMERIRIEQIEYERQQRSKHWTDDSGAGAEVGGDDHPAAGTYQNGLGVGPY